MTTVKATSSASFLGLVPQLLGFYPHESLVIVPFNAGRSLGAMRLDLPEIENMVTFSNTVTGLALKVESAHDYMLVAFTSKPAAETWGLLTQMQAKFGEAGLAYKDILYVGSDVFGSLLRYDEHPITELPVTLVEGVRAPQGTQRTMPVVEPLSVEMVNAMIAALAVEGTDISPYEFVAIGASVRKNAVEDLFPNTLGLLMVGLERPSARDIMLMTILDGHEAGDRAADAQLAWENDGAEYPESIASRMWGQGERPDADCLKNALAILLTMIATMESAGACAAAAWISWALGRSTHAEILAKQGLAIAPDHGLCEIVKSFVDAGHLPEWAFAGRG